MSFFEKILKEESPKLKTETVYLEHIEIPFSREEIEAEIERQEKLNPFIIVKNNNNEDLPVKPPVIFEPINEQELKTKPISRNELIQIEENVRSNLNESENARLSVSNTPSTRARNTNQLNNDALKQSESSKAVAVEVPIEKVKHVPIELENNFSVNKNVKDFMAEKAIEAIRKSTITNSKYKMGCSILTADNKVITGYKTENAAENINNCAEARAISKALAAGHKDFRYLALSSTYEGEGFDGPCKKCKSLLKKYAPDLKLLLVKNKDDVFECSLNDLINSNEKPTNNSSLPIEQPKPQKIFQQYPQRQFSSRSQQSQHIPVAHYVLGPQQNGYQYQPYFNNSNHGFFRNYW